MAKFKLIFYWTHSSQIGSFRKEEFFPNREAMDKRYKEVFVKSLYALNPTGWEWNNKKKDWIRILGY